MVRGRMQLASVTTAICKTQSRADGARFAYGQRFFSPVVYSIEQRTARTNGHEMEGRGERARQGDQSERASERAQGRMRAWAKRRMLDSRGLKKRVFERRHAPVNVDVETQTRGR